MLGCRRDWRIGEEGNWLSGIGQALRLAPTDDGVIPTFIGQYFTGGPIDANFDIDHFGKT